MAFLPQRVSVDAYGSGGFRFGAMSCPGSLLILPSGMHPWPTNSLLTANLASFNLLLAEKSEIDFLLLGTGADMAAPPEHLLAELAKAGVRVDWMSTGAAVRTYNIVLAEKRRVAAALIAVDQNHG